MKNTSNIDFGPQIPEPTEEEVKETIKNVEEKYEIIISKADAIKYTKLTNELIWWFATEKRSDLPESITEDMAKEIQDMVKKNRGKSITLEEAYSKARESLVLVTASEKDRVANEIREIIAKYK